MKSASPHVLAINSGSSSIRIAVYETAPAPPASPRRESSHPQPPSTMKTEPQTTAVKSSKDMKTFEQLPAKTKELELLMDQAKKSTGPVSFRLNKLIQDKAK